MMRVVGKQHRFIYSRDVRIKNALQALSHPCEWEVSGLEYSWLTNDKWMSGAIGMSGECCPLYAKPRKKALPPDFSSGVLPS